MTTKTAQLARTKAVARLAVARALYRSGRLAPPASPLIVAYHRVVEHDPYSYPPGMAVARATFEAQIAYLSDHFVFLPLSQIAACLASNRALPTGACAVTFDDGWADAFQVGREILRSAGCPATTFLTVSHIGTGREFWLSRLVRVLRAARGDGPAFSAWPKPLARQAAEFGRNGGPLPLQVATWLGSMTLERREALLDDAARVTGSEAIVQSDEFMSWDDVREWLSSGMEVGSHGCEHACLPREDARMVAEEVGESKRVIEQRTRQRVASFAYPYGDYNPAVRAAVVEAGYECACAVLSPSKPLDRFALPRRTLHEGTTAGPRGQFEPALLAWFLSGVFWRRRH